MAVLKLCPHKAEGARKLCGGLLYKGTNSIPEGSNHLSKNPLPDIITLGVRDPICEFWRNIQLITFNSFELRVFLGGKICLDE